MSEKQSAETPLANENNTSFGAFSFCFMDWRGGGCDFLGPPLVYRLGL